jgi:hypothetical protein
MQEAKRRQTGLGVVAGSRRWAMTHSGCGPRSFGAWCSGRQAIGETAGGGSSGGGVPTRLIRMYTRPAGRRSSAGVGGAKVGSFGDGGVLRRMWMFLKARGGCGGAAGAGAVGAGGKDAFEGCHSNGAQSPSLDPIRLRELGERGRPVCHFLQVPLRPGFGNRQPLGHSGSRRLRNPGQFPARAAFAGSSGPRHATASPPAGAVPFRSLAEADQWALGCKCTSRGSRALLPREACRGDYRPRLIQGVSVPISRAMPSRNVSG